MPLARIKKIMRIDEDVKVSLLYPHLHGCFYFIRVLQLIVLTSDFVYGIVYMECDLLHGECALSTLY